MHEEFKETFKRLALSFSEVERAIQCPKNYLSRFINGSGTLPSKWEVKIHQYLALQGLINTPKTAELKEGAPWAADILGNGSPAFDGNKINARMKELEWVGNVEGWCKTKGFPPSELIEKFESLEIFYEKFKNINMGQTQSVMHLQDMPIPHLSQNKPNTAPNPEKEGKTTPKQEKGLEKPEISPETGLPVSTSKPKELSPFLKSRQNLKNGIK